MTTTTDLVAEYHQLGRNTAGKSWATFATLVHSKTTAPHLIAAAIRGRQDALGEVTTPVEVRIIWRSASSVIAAVRGPVGDVVDVRWTAEDGGSWSCSCGEPGRCCHRDVLRQTLEELA
jgi:hypothetical protein